MSHSTTQNGLQDENEVAYPVGRSHTLSNNNVRYLMVRADGLGVKNHGVFLEAACRASVPGNRGIKRDTGD